MDCRRGIVCRKFDLLGQAAMEGQFQETGRIWALNSLIQTVGAGARRSVPGPIHVWATQVTDATTFDLV